MLTFKNTGDSNGYAKTFYIDSGTVVTSGTDVTFPGGSLGGTTWGSNNLKGHATCYDPRGKRFIIVGAWTNSGLDEPFGIMMAINAGADTLTFKGSTLFFNQGFPTYDSWDRWACLANFFEPLWAPGVLEAPLGAILRRFGRHSEQS